MTTHLNTFVQLATCATILSEPGTPSSLQTCVEKGSEKESHAPESTQPVGTEAGMALSNIRWPESAQETGLGRRASKEVEGQMDLTLVVGRAHGPHLHCYLPLRVLPIPTLSQALRGQTWTACEVSAWGRPSHYSLSFRFLLHVMG